MAGNAGDVSVGEAPDTGRPDRGVSNEPAVPDADSKTLGEGKGDPQKPAPPSTEFGEEGTNKTLPHPKPDNAPSEEPGGKQPHIPKSPYTRG